MLAWLWQDAEVLQTKQQMEATLSDVATQAARTSDGQHEAIASAVAEAEARLKAEHQEHLSRAVEEVRHSFPLSVIRLPALPSARRLN